MRRHPALEAALDAADATDQGLVHARDLRRGGVSGSTLQRAERAGVVHRVRRGVYARRPLERLPTPLVDKTVLSPLLVRAVRALLLSWGPHAAARRRTAALLRGWDLLVEPRKLEVAVRRGQTRRRDGGALVQQVRDLTYDEVVPPGGGSAIRVVRPWQAVLDALLTLPPVQAVVLADSALRAGDVTLDELRLRAAALPGRRRATHVRRLVQWCDPLSGSVLESVLRFRLHEAGIVGFVTQHVLQRNGTHVLRADLCFRAARLVVEVDGRRWHLDRDKDRLTDNQLAALGYRVLRFTWSEVVNDHVDVLARIRAALGTRCCQLPVPEQAAA